MDDPNAAPITNPQNPSSPRAFNPDKKYAIRIPKRFAADDLTTYWLEYRQHEGWAADPWVRDGIEIVLARSRRTVSREDRNTTLIDTTPETSNPDKGFGMTDAPVVIGKTYTDEVEGVSITPIAKAPDTDPAHPLPISEKWIDVRVNFFNGLDRAPVLTNTTPPADTVELAVGQPLQLTAEATDADGDTLAYNWQFEDASPTGFLPVYSTFGTNLPSATKQWSLRGDYQVRLIVSDLKGMVVSRSWIVRVNDQSGPTVTNRIRGRIADASGNPVQGVLVSAGGKRVVSDADGTYRISLPADAGSTTVTASKPGWSFTAPGFANATGATVFPGPDTVGVDFRATAATYTINGSISATDDDGVVRFGRGLIVRELRGGTVEPAGINDAFYNGNYTLYVSNGYNVVQVLDLSGNPAYSAEVRVEYGSVSEVNFDTWTSTTSGAGRPAVAIPAAAEPVTAGRAATVLSVTGTDPDGPAGGLTYKWSQVSGPAVNFPGYNGSHSARRIEMPLTQTGTYRFRVVIKDTSWVAYGDQPGDTGTEVTVTVGQVASYLRVTPDGDRLATGTSKQYTATPLDQWGQTMTGSVTWLAPVRVGNQSAGTLSSSGLFTAPGNAGRVSVKASLPGGVVAGATADVCAPATVANRWIAYRGAKDLVDNDLIAPDKHALLPGQCAATFENYTSYNRGINCIIIELTGAWGGISAADFVFRTGNTANPATWASPPAPTITPSDPAGAVGTLVKFTWPDYKMSAPDPSTQAVANGWLQITVLANTHTGLAAPDVFYFGNLIGDTHMNANGEYITLAEDWSATRSAVNAHYGAARLLDDEYDHDRDGFYTAADYQIVHDNFFASLYLITV
jgi:hypothetical protein